MKFVNFSMHRFLFILLLMSVSYSDNPKLYINELLASNASNNPDPDLSDFCDWIEIYNSEDTVVNIEGYYITDNLSDPFKFQFPDSSIIHPNSFIIVWADGEDYYPGNYHIYPEDIDIVIRDNHTNFKLNKSGEEVGLFSADGDLIDSIIFDQQITDISYGRKPNGSSEWFYFSNPSSLASNMSIGYLNTMRISSPQFSIMGGFYAGSQIIELTSESASETIRFTIDSSKPTVNSNIYISPIIIDSTTVIRACVYAEDILPSLVTTNTYFIDETSTLPVISIATDSEYLWDDHIGIYTTGINYSGGEDAQANYRRDWERPIHLEFYNTEQSQYSLISIDAGVKIYGGFTRHFPQKSLGIYLKPKYGYTSLNYQIFHDKPINIKRLVLRNGGNDWNHSILLDGLLSSLIAKKINVDYQAYKPSLVYINSNYWGLHNIREKMDEYYVESNYGIIGDDFDFLENDPFENGISIINGNSDHYEEMMDYIVQNDISQSVHYDYIRTQMDIDEYVNYQICEIYFANRDWPHNNQKYWRPAAQHGKWRWILYDLEYLSVHQDYTHNTLEHATSLTYGTKNIEWATLLFRELLKNETFESMFIQRFSHYLNTIFSMISMENMLDSIKMNIEQEIPMHSNRWRDECLIWQNRCGIQSIDDWESAVSFIQEFFYNRNNYMRQIIINYFELNDINTLTIDINYFNVGNIFISGAKVDTLPYSGPFFRGIPIFLTVVPDEGYAFVGWQGIEGEISNSDSISVVLMGDSTITAVFELMVTGVNNAPELAAIGVQLTNEDTSLVLILSAMDLEDDELTYTASSDEGSVTAEVDGTTLTLTPAINWNGTADITVTVDDGNDGSDGETFELTVTGVNDAPNQFGLVSPPNDATLSDINLESSIEFLWQESVDIDSDSLYYTFYIQNTDSLFYSVPFDLNSYTMPVDQLINIFPPENSILSLEWYVASIDYIDTTFTDPNIIQIETSNLGIDDILVPTEYNLLNPYPNPFNPLTVIKYAVPQVGYISISVYDMLGREIANLHNGSQIPGYHTITWDASNHASGIYFIKMVAGDYISTQKLMLVK